MCEENKVIAPMQSDGIGDLAAALAKAQGEIQKAHKDTTNPFFKSKYADLASVWDACREALSKNELAVIQTTQNKDGFAAIATLLAHSSGEWIKSELSVKLVKDDPQGLGSALTYLRRYALSAMVGISAADDDGETAMNRNSTPQKPQTTPKQGDAKGQTTKTPEKPSGVSTGAFKPILARIKECKSIPELEASKAKYLTPAWKQLNLPQRAEAEKAYNETKTAIIKALKNATDRDIAALISEAKGKIADLGLDECAWADLCYCITEDDNKRAPEKMDKKQLQGLIGLLDERLKKLEDDNNDVPF